MKRLRYAGLTAVAVIMLWSAAPAAYVSADAIPSDFNLQITPSPLVTTVTPGQRSTLELRVHNDGSGTEDLKIEPRSFHLSPDSKQVSLLDTAPADVGSWISFSQPRFSVKPGEWENEQITLNVPKDAGFSYSFALVISRQSLAKSTNGTRQLNGSVAVFTLINVDRPGATSQLSVPSFTTSKKLYDYLPTTFSVRFRNTGNTIVQPYGNIFVQRAGSKTPLATLTVNETRGYILPSTQRTITADWNDGFPVYKTTTNADGSTSRKLAWNWAQLSHLRIGRYTAHLVAAYNQAGHDVPIEGTVSFWVIPWKILLGLLAVTLLVLLAIFVLVRGIVRFVRRRILKTNPKPKPAAATPSAQPAANELPKDS